MSDKSDRGAKMKKFSVALSAIIIFAFFLVGAIQYTSEHEAAAYKEGYEAGYDEGYRAGYEEGLAD